MRVEFMMNLLHKTVSAATELLNSLLLHFILYQLK